MWEEGWWWWCVLTFMDSPLSYDPRVIKQSMEAGCGVCSVIELTGFRPWRVLKKKKKWRTDKSYLWVRLSHGPQSIRHSVTCCENPGVINLIGSSGLGRCSQIGRWITAVAATRGLKSRWCEYVRNDRFGSVDIRLRDGIRAMDLSVWSLWGMTEVYRFGYADIRLRDGL